MHTFIFIILVFITLLSACSKNNNTEVAIAGLKNDIEKSALSEATQESTKDLNLVLSSFKKNEVSKVLYSYKQTACTHEVKQLKKTKEYTLETVHQENGDIIAKLSRIGRETDINKMTGPSSLYQWVEILFRDHHAIEYLNEGTIEKNLYELNERRMAYFRSQIQKLPEEERAIAEEEIDMLHRGSNEKLKRDLTNNLDQEFSSFYSLSGLKVRQINQYEPVPKSILTEYTRSNQTWNGEMILKNKEASNDYTLSYEANLKLPYAEECVDFDRHAQLEQGSDHKCFVNGRIVGTYAVDYQGTISEFTIEKSHTGRGGKTNTFCWEYTKIPESKTELLSMQSQSHSTSELH